MARKHMVDKKMGLTFSLRNNPGVYALLLGSGVSREAGIRTGWGILKDLIRKVASVEGENPEPKPTEWYEEKYGEEARYDDVIEHLARSKEERQSLLEPYFEPTSNEERERGDKAPNKSHKSIAWLMKEGYINVVVTTNFDRLLEQALEEQGIKPTVISSTIEAEGAVPLAHQDNVILKIHGDYKATNLKNTNEELSSYEEPIENLLRQVFDEYGLIVSGWSGKWDDALREIMLSSKSQRYSLYWTTFSGLKEEGEKIIRHRNGTAISIGGASNFFADLKERVQALESAAPGAPLSREVARERTKRYLTREERRIDLADLIQNETDRLTEQLESEEHFGWKTDPDESDIEKRLTKYENLVEVLSVVFGTCAYWGPDVPNTAKNAIVKAVDRTITTRPPSPYIEPWTSQLGVYPSTLLVYSLGVAATDSRNWRLIAYLFDEITLRDVNNEKAPLCEEVHPEEIPFSPAEKSLIDRVKETTERSLHHILPNTNSYQERFYEFVLLMDMLYQNKFVRVTGSHQQTQRPTDLRLYTDAAVVERIISQGEEWGPLQLSILDWETADVNSYLQKRHPTVFM